MTTRLGDEYKVLLVEDSRDYQELFRIYARKAQLEIDIASTGKEALDYLRHNRVDGIILDYMLPDLTGLEILQALKKRRSLRMNRQTFSVVISAVEVPDRKLRELYLAGTRLFLPKSLGLRELSMIAHSVCVGSRAMRKDVPAAEVKSA